MNNRERYLAIATGGVLVLAAGQYILSGMMASLEAKSSRLASLNNSLGEQQNTVTRGILAKRAIDQISLRSLPSDLQSAKTIYTEWLIRFAAESKLLESKQDLLNEESKPGVYKVLRYSLSGKTNVVDLVGLLYRFYSSPYLHRITSMKLVKSPEYGRLALAMTIETLVLDAAAAKQPPPNPAAYKLLDRSLDDYLASIVRRNIAWPPNQPPRWPGDASASVAKNARLDYELKADEVDDGQNVEYELVETNADGLEIEGGRLVWAPQELGSYRAVVRATDSGIPAASSVHEIEIKVVDPPPPPEPEKPPQQFDAATQTKITALVSGRSGPEAMFKSHTDGKTARVRVGEQFELADIRGEVTAIGANYVEFETDGRRWTMGLDESLADAYRRSQVD